MSQPEIAEHSLKTLFLGFKFVQGHRCWYHSSAVLVTMSSKSVSICNLFHARRASSSKITISEGYPYLMPMFEGNLLSLWHQITSWETRESGLSYGEDSESLSHLALNPYRGSKLPHEKLETLVYHAVKTGSLYRTWPWIGTGSWHTDRLTDRTAIANTRSAVPAGTSCRA